MAYDRYDTRRDESRWRDSEFDRGSDRRDERGFFERAGDEIASWFGADDDRGGHRGERMHRDHQVSHHRDRMGHEGGWNREERGWGGNPDHGRDRDHERYAYRGSAGGWQRSRGGDRSWGDSPRGWERDSWADRERGSWPMPRSGANRDYSGGGWGGAFTGSDYDRNEGSRGHGRSETPWGRDEYRRASSGGTSHHDSHYHAWRQRQLDELDRDYDEYRRENQQRFESEFAKWRETRQQKRSLLGRVREHMEVVGSDGQTIGKVDKVHSDHLILTKTDSDDGRHHSIKCTMIDTVEGDQVRLSMPAEEAKSRWEDVDDRSMGRREEGEMNLERSFSGTYS